jgi:hypothetical protein
MHLQLLQWVCTKNVTIINFLVNITGPQNLLGKVSYVSNGQYSFTYSLTQAGSYKLTATINKLAIKGSPFTLRLEPANTVSAANCLMYGSQFNSTVAGIELW